MPASSGPCGNRACGFTSSSGTGSTRPGRTSTVEVWTYNYGSNKLMRELRFEGEELVDIRTIGYGY